MKAVLTHELAEFIKSHQSLVQANLPFRSEIYTLALLSATESVGWIESLMVFIENFMKQLTIHKFSTKKALHVTSRLVKRIFVEIFKPRQGIIKAFKTRDMMQVSTSVLWTCLQSLAVVVVLSLNE